jgi:hypothetical protein
VSFRRCLFSSGSFGSVTLEELQELCAARGLKPSFGATREVLEKLLFDSNNSARHSDSSHEMYRSLMPVSTVSPPPAKELPKSVSMGALTITVSADHQVMLESPCGIVSASASIDWSDRRSAPVFVSVSQRAESSGLIPQTFRRREGGVSDESRASASVISDVIRAASVAEFADGGFPHPSRVASQVRDFFLFFLCPLSSLFCFRFLFQSTSVLQVILLRQLLLCA